MSPDELQQQAQMRAMALRGQQMQPMPMQQDADVLSGIGGALAGWGGKSGQAVSENATKQGDALRRVAMEAQAQANSEKHAGVEDLLRQQQIAKTKQEMAESGAPASPVLVQILKGYGYDLPPGTTNGQATKIAEVAERGWAAKMAADAAKDKAAKDTKVPLAESDKFNNGVAGLSSIGELAKLHGKIGVMGMSPIGDSPLNNYSDAIKAHAGAIATATNPEARNNVGMIDATISALPSGINGHERALASFKQRADEIMRTNRTRLATLKAGGYSGPELADYEQKLNKAEQDVNAALGGGAAAGRQAVKDKSGKLLGYINPDGSEEMVK